MPVSANANPRRGQITEIAAELFDRRGYHETSMQAIADRAGVRKATLYHYFASKEAILTDLHEGFMQVVIGRQERRAAEVDQTPSTQLQAIMRDVVGLMESHPGQLRIFFESYRELPPDVRRSIAAERSRYRRMVTDVLAEGVRRGDFRQVDVELTATAMFSMMNWTYQWFRRSGPLTTDEVADYFWDLLVNGIGPSVK